MASHFSVPSFLRKTPNVLLQRYFEAKGVLAGFDFDKLPETRPEPLFKTWLELPDEVRGPMEAEFGEIFGMGGEKGYRAILDEAKFHFPEDPAGHAAFVEKLAALPGHIERAMTVFLDHPRFWHGALSFWHADSLPYWRKRKGLPTKKAAIDLESRGDLARAIGAFFRETEGRGRNCHVELLRRDQRDYFFIYPEDYGQQSLEWVEGQFSRRPLHPAFEVVYVWSASEGTLDTNHRGNRMALEPLQAIFAREILKIDRLPSNPKDEGVYDLNPLKRREFQFVHTVDSGIESVCVRKLRLSSQVRKGDRITLEAETSQNRLALYDVVEQAGRAIPLDQWNVTQAEVVVRLATTGEGAGRRETFTIGWPNSLSLKYDAMGLKLRAMLVASKIEPR